MQRIIVGVKRQASYRVIST